jgi:hypothetical protein
MMLTSMMRAGLLASSPDDVAMTAAWMTASTAPSTARRSASRSAMSACATDVIAHRLQEDIRGRVRRVNVEADHVMAGLDEVLDEVHADEACRAGDEYLHGRRGIMSSG